jgi:hypothetical protein
VSARAKRPTSTKPPPIPGRPKPHVDEDAKTSVYDSGNFGKEASSPIKAISMKTPGQDKIGADAYRAEPEVKKPKLRAMSEVHRAPKQQNLGYLAPPRDPAEVRARRVQDYVLWGSISVIVASIVALVIWFVAR